MFSVNRLVVSAGVGLVAVAMLVAPARASTKDAVRCDMIAVPGKPRPDLSGLRLRPPGGGIYVIDPEGYRRGVPGTVYWALFAHPERVTLDPHVVLIPERPAFSLTAFFARREGAGVFLISNGCKRGITGPAVSKYDFNVNKAAVLPAEVIAFIPAGPAWW